MHIYLIGLPGSGKTTLGKLAAERLGVPFYDVDALVELGAQMRISEIFDASGESRFRDMEHAALLNIAAQPPGVVATGGGLPVQPRNEQILADGLVLFVDRAPEAIMADIDTSGRPLLPDAERLRELSAVRRGVYERLCGARIEAKTVEEGVAEIVNIAPKTGEFHAN